MFVSRKVLIAILALGVVAVQDAAAPASAATETTTMSIGLTIVAPGSVAARHANSGSHAGAAPTSTGKATVRHDIRHSLDEPAMAALIGTSVIAKTAAVRPELTTHKIAGADTQVVTLSY